MKKPISAAGQVWLSRGRDNVLNGSRMALLDKIAETGSITKAGKAVGISYRTAWLTIDHLNGISDGPLVERTTGGKSGGGTRLTSQGESLLRVYRAIQEEHGKYMDRLREGIEDFDRFLHLTRKVSLKTSARNQWFGTVESIRKHALTATVVLRLKGKDKVVSKITVEGLESLGLRKGEEAYALIKANWISVGAANLKVKASAKNDGGRRVAADSTTDENALTGKIISLKMADQKTDRRAGQKAGEKGEQKAEMILQLAGGTNVVAMISLRTVKELKLAEGGPATAKFKASNVILGVAR